jgi:hypothetical protein
VKSLDPRTRTALTAVLHGMDPRSVEDLCRFAQREAVIHRDDGQPELQDDLCAMASAALDVHEFRAMVASRRDSLIGRFDDRRDALIVQPGGCEGVLLVFVDLPADHLSIAPLADLPYKVLEGCGAALAVGPIA